MNAHQRAEQITALYAELTSNDVDNEALLVDLFTDIALWGYANGLDSAEAARAALELHVPAEI